MTQLQIVRSLARLQCTECGAEANASCNCGKPYLPVEIAKQAIKANPQKSNRAIAKETGISQTFVDSVQKIMPDKLLLSSAAARLNFGA